MRWLILGASYVLLLLFCVGVFDLLVGLYGLLVTGRFTDQVAVLELLDAVLLLAIVVEIHGTFIAYLEGGPVVRRVVGVAIIAVAREALSFDVGAFGSVRGPISAALGLGLLLVVLGATYRVVSRVGSMAADSK